METCLLCNKSLVEIENNKVETRFAEEETVMIESKHFDFLPKYKVSVRLICGSCGTIFYKLSLDEKSKCLPQLLTLPEGRLIAVTYIQKRGLLTA